MRINQGRKSQRLRDNSPSKEVHNNWEISYGDMITLLLGFFILFFNIKTDRVNMKLLVEKLEKKFNTATGASVQTGVQQRNVSTKHLLATPALQKYKLHANLAGDKLHIEFPAVSFFAPGKIALTPEGQGALKIFAETIGKNIGSVRLVVRAYTDNSRGKITAKGQLDNLELSARRSLSAIRYLYSKGIDLKYMRIGGYGEADLTDRRIPASDRRFDRKVVIVVEPLDVAERGHESLNKIADSEEQKRLNKEREAADKLRRMRHPIMDFIEAKSIEAWLAADYPVQKLAAPATALAPSAKNPSRDPAEAPVPAWSDRVSAWINQTYLYKKINPYYMNQNSKNKKSPNHRGDQ